MCPIKLNGISSWALVDSGNTVAPAISLQFAKTIFGDNYLDQLQSYGGRPLRAAGSGVAMQIIGETKTKLTLHIGALRRAFHIQPLVIDHLHTNLNLSGPFLGQQDRSTSLKRVFEVQTNNY